MKKPLFMIAAGAIAAAQASAAIVNVGLTSVTQIRSDNTTKNYGSDGSLIIGKTTAPAILHGLLATTLNSSGIPAGATINSISLTLTVIGTGTTTNASGAMNLNLHQLTGAFTEGTGDASGNSANDATWNNRTTATPWTTPGGDYSGILSTAADDPSTGTLGSETIVFASTTAFVAAAQTAFNTSTNLSLLLKLNDTAEAENIRRAFFYASDDYPTTEYRPFLTIDYTIPEPTSDILASSGLGLLALRRRR